MTRRLSGISALIFLYSGIFFGETHAAEDPPYWYSIDQIRAQNGSKPESQLNSKSMSKLYQQRSRLADIDRKVKEAERQLEQEIRLKKELSKLQDQESVLVTRLEKLEREILILQTENADRISQLMYSKKNRDSMTNLQTLVQSAARKQPREAESADKMITRKSGLPHIISSTIKSVASYLGY